MEANEISKAASAVWGNGGRALPGEIERKYDSAQCEPAHKVPAPQIPYSHEEKQRICAFAERVGQRIAKSLKKYAKKSGPGPAGGRFEHWQSIGDDDIIERVWILSFQLFFQKRPGIGIVDRYAGVVQRVVAELAKAEMGGKQVGDRRIEVNEINAFDGLVLKYFARYQTITAAKN